MIDHISIGASDLKKSRLFYDRVLEPLGYRRLFDDADMSSGYGVETPEFWIDKPLNGNPASTGNGIHIAFLAPTRWAVDAFHAQAMLMGGQDQGMPGLRPEYGEHYYAAFVLDLDGHKIEAVIHLPETN
jgi:catechol 2,3-dioxygenase-like lactoylglutathione lyase family enzyme